MLRILQKVRFFLQNTAQIESFYIQNLIQVNTGLFTLKNNRGAINFAHSLTKSLDF